MGIVTTVRELRAAMSMVQQVNSRGCVQIDTGNIVALTARENEDAYALSPKPIGDDRSTGARAIFRTHGAMPVPVIVSGPALKATLVGAKAREEVAITVDPDPDGRPHTVRVNAGMGERRIPVVRIGDSLDLELPDNAEVRHTHTISAIVGDFGSMLAAVHSAAEHDAGNIYRSGVLLEVDRAEEGALYAVATNVFRLHRSRIEARLHATEEADGEAPAMLKRVMYTQDVRKTLRVAFKRNNPAATVSIQLLETPKRKSALFLFPNGDLVLLHFVLDSWVDYRRIVPTRSDTEGVHFEFDTAEMKATLKAMVAGKPANAKDMPRVEIDYGSNWMRAITPKDSTEYAAGPLPRANGTSPGMKATYRVPDLYQAIEPITQAVGRMQFASLTAVHRIEGVGDGPEYMSLIMPIVKKQ